MTRDILRSATAFLLLLLSGSGTAQAHDVVAADGARTAIAALLPHERGADGAGGTLGHTLEDALPDTLPDAPSVVRFGEARFGEAQTVVETQPVKEARPVFERVKFQPLQLEPELVMVPAASLWEDGVAAAQSRTVLKSPRDEPYHWKGLLLQSFAFSAIENGVRIITADQDDRHILLNKPFWSDYWASLQQFNMRRWNDGDSVPVNYVGHPMQGAISGYIEIQNDPKARGIRIGKSPLYWRGLWKSFLWSVVYSTASEIGPLGEAAIFNEGGFTYPIGCPPHDIPCQLTDKKYTNNTGWVDFIITPVVGTLWIMGEDTLDKYVSDPLVEKHPKAIGYKILRGGLNPTKSFANLMRGRVPWYRDEEHPGVYESPIVESFEREMDEEPRDHVDMFFHYSALSVNVDTPRCTGCRQVTTGAGMEYGFAVRKYLDLIVDTSLQPAASPGSSLNIGGTLWTGFAGVRSGYSGEHFAMKLTLAPGFASYSRSEPLPNGPLTRNFNFAAVLALESELRLSRHFAVRTTVQQMLIRYKSLDRDPPGIGQPPRLSFLSHDNYINSTNWGFQVGPVLRF
jgi:hypothetical protein